MSELHQATNNPPSPSSSAAHKTSPVTRRSPGTEPTRRVGRRAWQWLTTPFRSRLVLFWALWTAWFSLLIIWAFCLAHLNTASQFSPDIQLELRDSLIKRIPFVPLAVSVISIPIAVVMARRARRVRRAECCPCMHCGYTLTGLPRRSRCPECGTAHDVIRLHQFWRRGLLTRKHIDWRDVRELILGVVGSLVIAIAPALWNHILNGPFDGIEFMLLATLLTIIFYVWATIGYRRKLIRNRFALCRKCESGLHQQPPRGTCPKCSTAYDKRELRKYWKEKWSPSWGDVIVSARRAEQLLNARE